MRDRMRCPLALSGKDAAGIPRRPPRTPAIAAAYRVDMGPQGKAEMFTSCPVPVALTRSTTRYLNTYGMLKRFAKWPPGRDDPRLLEALSVIQIEHDDLDAEAIEKATTTPRRKAQ